MEFLHRIVLYLYFYRRVIYGMALVAALVWWLVIGKDQFADWSTARNKTPGEAEDSERRLPKLKPFSELVRKPEQTDPPTNQSKPSESKTKHSGTTIRELLASGDANDLMAEIVRLNRQVNVASPQVGFMMARNKCRIYRRLLELDISEGHRKATIIGYLESISVADAINVQKKLGVSGIRQELLELSRSYLDNPDPDISSLAGLVLIRARSIDFLKDTTRPELAALEVTFDENVDAVVAVPARARLLAEIVISVYKSPVLNYEAKQFAARAIKRFADHPSEKIQSIYLNMQKTVLLEPLHLDTLVKRMEVIDFEVKRDITNLFDTLEQFPEARLQDYQVAIDVIRKLLQADQPDWANELISRFEADIAPKIEPESKKDNILSALQELKDFL